MPELILDIHKLKTPIDHPDASITQAKLAAALWNALEKIANKGAANGYAELDNSALIPTTRIPNLTRSKITDFFNSPFWNNIPDKPSSFTPSAHQSTHRSGGSDALPWGSGGGLDVDLLDGSHKDWIRDWNNLLNKPSSFTPSTHASTHASGGSDAVSLARSQITDFFATPFWDNIPDKPSGFLKKVAEVSPSSNVTSFDITGLDINTHKFYLIFVRFKNATGSSITFYMFIEGDTTQSNYIHRWFYGDGSSAYTGTSNYAVLCDAPASGPGTAMVWLQRDYDGYARWFVTENVHSVVTMTRAIRKTTTVSNITQLRFQSSASNGIAAGSRVTIYGGE